MLPKKISDRYTRLCSHIGSLIFDSLSLVPIHAALDGSGWSIFYMNIECIFSIIPTSVGWRQGIGVTSSLPGKSADEDFVPNYNQSFK